MDTLERAVIRRIGGKAVLKDVCRGGADAGFSGFCYYSETTAFYRRFRKAINDMVSELADDMGENVLDVVKGFRCLNGEYNTSEIAQVMFGKWQDTDDYNTIGNALAWFALETVAFRYDN